MSCLVLCLTCKAAGLKTCPFVAGAPLPLVDAERPKVFYRGNLWYSDGQRRLIWSKANDPTDWSSTKWSEP